MDLATTLKELFAQIEQKINDTLQDEVKDKIKEFELKHIESDVYDKYEPKMYSRRRENDGLLDGENIKGELVSNGVLVVTNETMANPDLPNGRQSKNSGEYLTPIIESGQGYNDNFPDTGDYLGRYYKVPRPFIENTRQELKSSKAHKTALMVGLKKRGVDVR